MMQTSHTLWRVILAILIGLNTGVYLAALKYLIPDLDPRYYDYAWNCNPLLVFVGKYRIMLVLLGYLILCVSMPCTLIARNKWVWLFIPIMSVITLITATILVLFAAYAYWTDL